MSVDRLRSTSRADFRPPVLRLWMLLPWVALALASGCKTSTAVLDDFSADGTPRLQNLEPARRGPVINAAAFNASAISRTIAPYRGFVGSERVGYPADRASIESDLNDLAQIAPPDFNPNEMVTIDFNNVSLNYILEQLLGGALGVNYIAPKDLPENIDLRTETPIPKSRVIQVVRDLLARHDLVMRMMNGVYQIGSPQLIATLRENAAAGRSGLEVVKVIRIGRHNADEVAGLAGKLLAGQPNVSITATGSQGDIVVKADPNDMAAIEGLIRTLSQTAAGSNEVAIIPLRRSAPDAVATQLNDFYSKTLRDETSQATVIPLANQQAILVGASDPALMKGIEQLADQLDRSVTDVSDLRIIPITNLRAEDIAPKLAEIFGSSANQEKPQPSESSAKRAESLTGVTSRFVKPGPLAPESDNADGTGINVPSPALSAVRPTGGNGKGGGNGGAVQGGGQAGNSGSNGGPFTPSTTTAPKPGETRIVADTRTNSILVYSTYSVYKRMRQVVQTLDVPQAQVVIEATVVEVQLNDELSSGVQFYLQSHGIGVGSGIPEGNQSPYKGGVVGVGTNLGSLSIDAVLKALRSVTNLKVVSSPYLTVVDAQTARLVIGDQIPFASTTQTSNNQGNVTVTQNVQILNTGVVLQITPHIHADNSVDLDVTQSVSTPASQRSENSLTPTIATRDITSKLLAQSGRTVLLGGLIQDRIERGQDGVPGASKIPVLGNLFKQNTSTAKRTELLVMITPRVVRSSSQIESITRMLQKVRPGDRYGIIGSRR